MILVTGGAGYIGSHTCIELIKAGYELIVLDNLVNTSIHALQHVEKIVGKRIHFIQGDIRNKTDLNSVFQQYDIEAVIHFAGLKSPTQSLINPQDYYSTNVGGTLNLLNVMEAYQCKTLIFSSSASIYAESSDGAISEDFATRPSTPYSRSKFMVEEMLQDLYAADPSRSIAILRYFNPVGAHESGLIGENPSGVPTNLMPCVLQVAAGKRDKLEVYGNDYPTPDGTGIRDYIHVMDLATAHALTLQTLFNMPPQLQILNIGSGTGYSVLELIHTFESVTGCTIPYDIVARRPNDLARSLADPSRANEVLNWKAQYDLADMCRDSWRWQSNQSY